VLAASVVGNRANVHFRIPSLPAIVFFFAYLDLPLLSVQAARAGFLSVAGFSYGQPRFLTSSLDKPISTGYLRPDPTCRCLKSAWCTAEQSLSCDKRGHAYAKG
jgi:hypothetical protein